MHHLRANHYLTFADLESSPLLEHCGVIYHSGLQILICIACEAAFVPDHMKTHKKDQHNNFVITDDDLANITANFTIQEHAADVHSPPPGQAPIEGIKIEKGIQCDSEGCTYACIQESTMKNHWSKVHGSKKGKTSSWDRFHTVDVQSLFLSQSGRRHYFSVNPRLRAAVPSDPFNLFMQQHGDQANITPSVAPPTRDRDLPIFVKKLGWYEYLEVYCEDKEKRTKLIEMTALPHEQDGCLFRLPKVIEAYLNQIQREEGEVTRRTRRSLMSYPM
jgi:hypothetical protein